VHGSADAVHDALTMPAPEGALRTAARRRRVAAYNAERSARAFLRALGSGRR
jgi:trehalose-6-phosphate synthase